MDPSLSDPGNADVSVGCPPGAKTTAASFDCARIIPVGPPAQAIPPNPGNLSPDLSNRERLERTHKTRSVLRPPTLQS